MYTIAILGVGGRGGDAYGQLINQEKDKFKIVALCEKRKDRLERFGTLFNVDKELCFVDENEFFKKKYADLLIIATQDQDHIRHAIKAFEVGYDILLEKPITDKIEECEKLLAAQKTYKKKALVCHVLRYAPPFLKVAELLESGKIGKLIAINALERVGFWHQAHSYIRGNWRNSNTATPMILAKCCHDLDLLQFYAKAKCTSISSIGELAYFKKENAPQGAAERCTNCKYIDQCAYSAKYIYIDRWKESNCPEDCWPYNVPASSPVTEEKLQNAIEQGNYGKCVFACDNNVVDHQIVNMTFENGVKAELTMTGFTSDVGRRMHFFGTEGELIFDESANLIELKRFHGKHETYNMQSLVEGGYGHGGGDIGLVHTLYEMLEGKAAYITSLEASIESHLMGIYAEESRKDNGRLIYMHS